MLRLKNRFHQSRFKKTKNIFSPLTVMTGSTERKVTDQQRLIQLLRETSSLLVMLLVKVPLKKLFSQQMRVIPIMREI